MTIHNICIVAGCALWLYLLLCLLVKMHSDRRQVRKLQKQRAAINRFFSPETDQAAREKAFKRLRRLVRDDLLLDYACNRYLEAIAVSAPEDAAALEVAMNQLLHSQAEAAARLSPAARCLLMEDLCRCGFQSEWVHQFLREYGSSSALAARWATQLSHQQPEMAR